MNRKEILKNPVFFKPTEKLEQSKSMLINYIVKKIRDYDEPTRKGTPIGQTIGFSRKKYAATLWLLTAINTKGIAEEVGVSAGFLRKWKIEDAFKKKIKENEKEYIEYHWQHFKKLYEKLAWNKTLDDYRFYSKNLFEAISKQTNFELKKIVTGKNVDTKTEAKDFYYMYWLIAYSHIDPENPELRKMWYGRFETMAKIGYDLIEEFIKNPTEENMQKAPIILKGLKLSHLYALKELYKIE